MAEEMEQEVGVEDQGGKAHRVDLGKEHELEAVEIAASKLRRT